MFTKTLPRLPIFASLIILLASCGGGGGGSSEGSNNSSYTPSTPSTPSTASVTTSIEISSEKGYVGDAFNLTWSSDNATSCSALNAWTASNNISGSATVTPDSSGLLTFEISCSGDGGSDSA